MKKNIIVFSGAVIISGLLWQCTKKADDVGGSLKESLNAGAEKVNIAVDKISKTSGYKILNIREDETTKALINVEADYGDSINLSDISGVYEYEPLKYRSWCFLCFDKLFKKTGDNNELIIKLPSEKVFHPRKFRNLDPADSTLKNDFVISATDYHHYFSKKMGSQFDYKLKAGVSIDNSNAGNMDITKWGSSIFDYHNNSKYTFENGYSVVMDVHMGDTAKTSFSLRDNGGVLLMETYTRLGKQGSKYNEKEYSLVIGNFEFKKLADRDSIQIFVNGVLQQNAIIEIIDDTSSQSDEHSLFKNRDVQITFDDGSKVVLSELIGPSLAALRNLVSSMKNVYFASHIVDYVAWNIYKNK